MNKKGEARTVLRPFWGLVFKVRSPRFNPSITAFKAVVDNFAEALTQQSC